MKKIKNFYKNKKILVTGATGFKGSWLCSWLLKLGSKVYGTGFNTNNKKILFYKLNLNNRINLKKFDIRNYTKLKKFISTSKPSIIFHLAAQPIIYKSYQNPYDTFDINCKGTLNILEMAKKYKFIKSVVIVTSIDVYKNIGKFKGYKESDELGGADPYSASKTISELIVKAHRESFFKNKKKCGISSARTGNVIGGGDWSEKRLIPACIKSLIKNKVILLRNPNSVRPWQFVLEPLKGYLILAKKQFENPKKFSGAWNFGTEPKSITGASTYDVTGESLGRFDVDRPEPPKRRKIGQGTMYEMFFLFFSILLWPIAIGMSALLILNIPTRYGSWTMEEHSLVLVPFYFAASLCSFVVFRIDKEARSGEIYAKEKEKKG